MGLRLNVRRVLPLGLACAALPLVFGFDFMATFKWPLVIVGLGFIIFVHELGHFLVAKWCGVKCEKFFVGFDIGGWKISRKWGETEYGIGILPLGGYVKMLGQDDNPYRVREEMERAKLAAEEKTAAETAVIGEGADGEEPGAGGEASESLPPAPEGYQLDPRSYMAKSVPQRMAIISAGVIMNVIFAFILASIAYMMGVEYTPCVVGSINAGGAAWMADIRPGDEIIKVGDIEKPRFPQDLVAAMAFPPEEGVDLLVKRPGVEEPFVINVKPQFERNNIFRRGGIGPASGTTLLEERPLIPDSPAAGSQPGFEGGDTIVAINDVPIRTYAELHEQFVLHIDETVQVKVRRGKGADQQTLAIDVGPTPMKRLGLVMAMGDITAVKPGSPAAKAGFRPGDRISEVKHDGKSLQPLDPMVLPQQLARLAGQEVTVTVVRGSSELSFEVRLVQPRWAEEPREPGMPMSAPALGVTYRVLNVVESLVGASPAARSGKIRPGDQITEVRIIQPDVDDFDDKSVLRDRELSFTISEENPNWPFAIASALQKTLKDTKVELTVRDRDEPIELEPVADDTWHLPRRGMFLEGAKHVRQAETLAEAARLGLRETGESLTLVVKFLRGLFTQEVSPLAAGGPIMIVQAAGSSAESGPASLLIFLAMLSANLAVINALPIPVLDGGHFMFLCIEGIRRKPVSEKIFVAFTYLGFAFILVLMLFVISIDIIRPYLMDWRNGMG